MAKAPLSTVASNYWTTDYQPFSGSVPPVTGVMTRTPLWRDVRLSGASSGSPPLRTVSDRSVATLALDTAAVYFASAFSKAPRDQGD